jgi:ABC-type nitrate/sulfonate/bicarbonate transport system substrate-binding protein
MNAKNIQSNITVVFWIIILALAVSACSTQSQAAEEPDRVTLQLNWVYQTQFGGYFVAAQEGLYANENLKVDIVPGDGSFKPIDKVIAKEADFAIITDPIEVLQAREKGQPVVVVAALYQQNANVWISLADKNITNVQDMIGQRVGVRPVGEVADRILYAAAGVDRKELNEVTINDFTIRPLIDDEVDVLHDYALSGPLLAKRQGYDLNVITLADQGVLMPNELLAVREDLLQTNPDLVRRFVQASVKGWERAVKDPEAGVKATLQFDETLDVTQQTDMMKAAIALVDPEAAPIGHMDDKMWQQITQIALDQQLISAPIELDKIYTTEFLK